MNIHAYRQLKASLLQAAHAAAARGWQIFPLRPGAKLPAIGRWEQQAANTYEWVNHWWTRRPYNIGIACGPSKLVAIDLDTAKPDEAPPPECSGRGITSGAQVLDQLLARQPSAATVTATYTVVTPSGGRHLYYRAPTNVQLRNTAGELGWLIDTRAHGGMVVAAGSVLAKHDRPYQSVNHRNTQALAREFAGARWKNTDLVFASQIGTELSARNVRREFRRVLGKTNIKPQAWTPRELRHTFVSILSDHGVPIDVVAELVGHEGSGTTETVYRHQLRPVLLHATAVMDEIFE